MAGSAAGFFGLLALLAFQLGAGNDPALGAGTATVPDAPRKVVVRKVRRRVIVGGTAGVAPSAGVPPAGTAPAPTSPAPARAAAPAAAPAPAPAPVTRSS